MKILVLTNEKLNGVLFYRCVMPHAYMARNHQVKYTNLLLLMPDEELEKYDILFMSYFNYDENDISRCRRLGVKVVIDIDDYWVVDRFHELYDHFQETDRKNNIPKIIQQADGVTTTTERLASKVGLYHDNVCIIKNVLMNDNFVNPRQNQIPLFAWVGGNNHTADLFIIQHLQKGYKFPVYVPEMYRLIFKDNFLYYPPQPIPNYLGLYNEYDIILASLRDAEFNTYKSPLKVMEAGMFEKPLIVSDVDPFSEYLRHKENCLVVKKPSEWAKWAKVLSDDEDMRKELGKNLNADVVREFNIDVETKKREAFYTSLSN